MLNKSVILYIDDDEIILNSLAEQLKHHLSQNYNIEFTSDAEEALAICQELAQKQINIALIISEQNLPKISGDKLLIKLHAYYPKALKILLANQAEINAIPNIVKSILLCYYIIKPWDETDLIITVQEALKSYQQETRLINQNILLKQENKEISQSLDLVLAALKAVDNALLILNHQDEIIAYNTQFKLLCHTHNIDITNTLSIFNSILNQAYQPLYCDIKEDQLAITNTECYILKFNNDITLELSIQTQKFEQKAIGQIWGIKDITASTKLQSEAEYRANHDTLTELPKRRILTCQLTDAIKTAQKNSQIVAVMFVELDRFKVVSDTLGHQIGDRLLQKVVNRLKNCIRGEDLIARWGRDEFTLLLPKAQNQASVSAIAQRILNIFKSPFEIDHQPIYVNSHIGIATYPEHGQDAETVLKNADAALSQAQKLKYNNYCYYDLADNSQAHKLLTIENQLYSALENNEFMVYYQPIVNIFTGKIAKMEALLRWNNPEFGFISPGTFIPLAEANGSIIPIGEWVLKTACSQNKAWQTMGLEPIKISVNLSVRQFQQPNLVANIESILQQTQLFPWDLEVEITESLTIQDTQLAKTILQEFRQMQVCLSMDDFGTGYSSLGYLKQFPFNTLKIDRSFIKDLYFSPEDLAIVDAIITLGQGLNLDVVAEGVETAQLQNLLKNLGCEYIQGYLYSQPVPAGEATDLLLNNNWIMTIDK